jgi:demethylmenaquinone methyltransferase/2-methoxy-6-polyprenyl-1,4-benzoquinol methylase
MKHTKTSSAGTERDRRRAIAGMFNRIAPTYDLLNGLLSAGQHLRWAKHMLLIAKPEDGEAWLDLATGSASLIKLGKKRTPGSIWFGLDPSRQLLYRGQRRVGAGTTVLVEGFGENLPFSDSVFNGITIAYGLRNYTDPSAGLAEMARVLKPGGRVHILEFHPAGNRGGWGKIAPIRFYVEKILPRIGCLVSGDPDAYSYLARTAGSFWTSERLADRMRENGFHNIQQHHWMNEVVTLTTGRK